MNINQAVSLNMSTDIAPPTLHMAQGDANSRTIVATLYDGSQPFTIPTDSVCMVRFGKPDGTGGLYDHTEAGTAVTYLDNVVTAPVASQMLSVSGIVKAEIDVYKSSGSNESAIKLASFCFLVDVHQSAYYDDTIISSDYYNIISADISEFRTAQEQIIASQAALEEVAKSITGNVESAQQAAQTATEKANAAATSAQNAASSETSANNANAAAQTAKTNAESAKTAAENAKIAAQAAQTAAENAKNDAESAKIAAETANQSAIASAEEAQNFATAMQECAPYDNAKSYVVANMVTSGGSTYRCIKPCTGISPPNSTYWLLIAQKGADGLGSGDMTKAVYDPQEKAQDIFAYADAKYSKPSGGIPKTDLASAVQTSLGKADSALQSVPSTYRTASAQDEIDSGKQDKITASGILKGDGAGGVSAAVKGTDYAGASETVMAMLLAASWTGDATPYGYTLTVSGVTATSNQEVLPALNITAEQLEALQSANIQDGGQAANTMTLKAYGDKPTVDIPIRVIKRGD